MAPGTLGVLQGFPYLYLASHDGKRAITYSVRIWTPDGMSAKSNFGEINESYASACQTQETSELFATLNDGRR
jgi:hypothetical protein